MLEDLFTEFDIIIEQDESSPDCGPPPVPTQVCYDEANSPTIDFCALANDHGYMCPPALDTQFVSVFLSHDPKRTNITECESPAIPFW